MATKAQLAQIKKLQASVDAQKQKVATTQRSGKQIALQFHQQSTLCI